MKPLINLKARVSGAVKALTEATKKADEKAAAQAIGLTEYSMQTSDLAPERQPGESFDAYKLRRKAAKAFTKEMLRGSVVWPSSVLKTYRHGDIIPSDGRGK